MKKKEFIKIMKDLLQIKKDEENLNKAFKRFEPDFNYISFGRYEMLVVDALKYAMEDKGDWLEWWLYECDYGRDKKMVKSLEDKDGKKLMPKGTLSELYDVISN